MMDNEYGDWQGIEVTEECGCKLIINGNKFVPCGPEHYVLHSYLMNKMNPKVIGPKKPQIDRLKPIEE